MINICIQCKKQFKHNRKRLYCFDCHPNISINKKERIYHCLVKRRKEHKMKIVKICGNKCCICGYDKCYEALEFHHVNEKDFTIANALMTYPWHQILKEVEKTILVCANCHREIHNGFYSNNILKEKLKENVDRIHYYIQYEQLILILNSLLKERINNIKRSRRKVERPTYKQFIVEMNELHWNYCAMGRKYGVSDNAIRKWEKAYKNGKNF